MLLIGDGHLSEVDLKDRGQTCGDGPLHACARSGRTDGLHDALIVSRGAARTPADADVGHDEAGSQEHAGMPTSSPTRAGWPAAPEKRRLKRERAATRRRRSSSDTSESEAITKPFRGGAPVRTLPATAQGGWAAFRSKCAE